MLVAAQILGAHKPHQIFRIDRRQLPYVIKCNSSALSLIHSNSIETIWFDLFQFVSKPLFCLPVSYLDVILMKS